MRHNRGILVALVRALTRLCSVELILSRRDCMLRRSRNVHTERWRSDESAVLRTAGSPGPSSKGVRARMEQVHGPAHARHAKVCARYHSETELPSAQKGRR